MKPSRSPWIHQLNHERKIARLSGDVTTDVTIVGAGIAGVSTAFFILRNTDKRVIIVEKNRLAHGATGHNAGQIVSYFERPFTDMVKEFGLDMTARGWEAVESGWTLAELMYTEAGLTIPFSRFKGHVGFSSEQQTLNFLKDLSLRKQAGLSLEECYVADDAPFLSKIPAEYSSLYQIVPRQAILDRLETKNDSFCACLSSQNGTMNSALFCQEVMSYLLNKYSDRCVLYEQTTVLKLVLKKDRAILDADHHTITTSRVVLCTNGFENVTILNESGLDIDGKFHHNISGKVGYMSGYLERYNKPPTAIRYFTDPDESAEDPYFYVTRRMYEYGKGIAHNLICIGGPDIDLEDRREYIADYDYPEEAQKEIDEFIKTTYEGKKEYKFTWHGLMGYTRNGIRLIGPEPKNPVLMYNLGCNGIGLLPSIYGGEKIARIVLAHESGSTIEPSIFDPK